MGSDRHNRVEGVPQDDAEMFLERRWIPAPDGTPGAYEWPFSDAADWPPGYENVIAEASSRK